MAYQVLARKWRPNQFSELVGQEHVVTAISNALDNNRLHHAYLFTGTRGVGKTTIARIFSKSLNCETGMSATPCGQCHTCKEIENGSFVDLLEIDAASRTKVEDTRELLDNVQYKPTRGEYKVYLIDEVHMLSKHSFNALLKTLEEPPPHVKFLLATTDPQKLPVTILSRCLQFNLKALSREQISQQLSYVLEQEHIPFDKPALLQLSRAAQGSMRDALSLTDQAIAQGNGQVTNQIVTDMLGLMDKGQVIKLVHSLFSNKASEVMALVEALSQQAADYEQVLGEMMSLLHQVALTQFVPEACKLETVSARAVYQLSKMLAPEQVQLNYQIALQGKKDIAFAADARVGLEMTLLRMMAFNPTPLNLSIDDTVDLSREEIAAVASTASEATTEALVSGGDEKHKLQPLSDESDVDKASLTEELVSQQADIIRQAESLTPNSQPAKEPGPSSQDSYSADFSEQNFEQNTAHQNIDSADDDFYFYQNEQAASECSAQMPPEHINHDYAPDVSATGSRASTAQVTSQVSLTSTQSLIDLKNKLAQKETGSEVADASTKKSESKADFSRFSPKSPINEQPITKLFLPPDNPSTSEQSETTAPQDIPSSVLPSSEVGRPRDFTVARDYEPAKSTTLLCQDTSAMHEGGYTHQGLQTEPQVQSGQLKGHADIPPWESNQNSAIPASIIDDQDSSQFDPMAHLQEDVDVEVDFDIPVFLENGEKVIAAHQLDTWSQIIEASNVAGLTKQLALHSAYTKNANVVTLNLIESKPHLDTELARNQLQQALSEVFQQPIELLVEHEKPKNTPYAVQRSINQVRIAHARDVAENDENIGLIKSVFSARVLNDSIKPR
ncbi:DNA polymerase III subunit gamma/tau [Aliiglaciecola sp. LCG003]|uniref:DNA polymerase III subunit gamma/tau n=1 Tax=Aliiglaciecola sp. LCG003 TaxID=3053655 RepID=UPI0025748DF6|nr:DNA polymerase III subunit gamma/tau [Aliiglaciecola sp. LCG003]WJG08009.1 DNA polymerase III subunit gamma/tau [Aliiglaciecola sp. LCG003]